MVKTNHTDNLDNVFLELAKASHAKDSALEVHANRVTEHCAEALSASCVSIWTFSNCKSQLTCISSYVTAQFAHKAQEIIQKQSDANVSSIKTKNHCQKMWGNMNENKLIAFEKFGDTPRPTP